MSSDPSDVASFPPLYQGWIDAFVGGPIPAETEATCEDCAMCARPEEPAPPGSVHFDPTIKCCSFLPELPNFLVGRILADDDPAMSHGRASVIERIEARVAVTPLGLGRPAMYRMLYDRGALAFGRSRTLRCPHYRQDDGACSIWRHRDSTCSTWFCKYVRGAVGQSFWRALHQLLGVAERTLARQCVLELGVGTAALRRLFPYTWGGSDEPEPLRHDEVDGWVEEVEHRARWGSWAGRERELYLACGELAGATTWADLRRLAGPELALFEGLVQSAYAELQADGVGGPYRMGSIEVIGAGTDVDRVRTYNPYDAIDLPRPLLDLLRAFDGRTTEHVLDAIAEEHGIEIDPGLVRRLVDFQVLVEMGGEGEGD